jgi:hypothetical protein
MLLSIFTLIVSFLVDKKCQECDIPEEKCNEIKAQKCFDDWINACD